MEVSTETEIMRLMKVLHLRLEIHMNRIFEKYGLTAAQMDVLQYIIRQGSETTISTDVYQRMYLSKANVSNIIKKLRAKGFLEFKPNPKDDRQKMLIVTMKSKTLNQELESAFVSEKLRMFQNFSKEELEMLKNLLEQLFSNFKNQEYMEDFIC